MAIIQTAIGATQADTFVYEDSEHGWYVVEVRLMSFDRPGLARPAFGRATYPSMNRYGAEFGSLSATPPTARSSPCSTQPSP